MTFNLSLTLYSLRDFYDRGLASSVLNTIFTASKHLVPKLYGPYEPLKPLPSSGVHETLLGTWMNDTVATEEYQPQMGVLLLRGRSPAKSRYMVAWDRTPGELFNMITASVAGDYAVHSEGLDQFMDVVTRLCGLVDGVWGEIAWRGPETSNASSLFDLHVRMPPPTWALILGQPYIDLFGEERIQSTPCAAVRRLHSGQFVLQTTESPDSLPSPELVRGVCEHLGKDAFMEPGKSVRAYKTGLAPVFVSNIH